MAGEIFISYRRADEAWARLLHGQLRAEGVEAWYDAQVGAGQDWRIATARALETSQIFVLLFTSNAAESSDIAKELAAATLEKKLIIPVRLENIAPKGAFLYELASRNWINAYDDTEAKLAELAKGLAHLVRTGARDESVLSFDRSGDTKPATPPRKSLRTPALIATGVIAAVAAFAIAAWLLWPAKPSGISVAVLPFVNMSGEASQNFFSDGMTEEITSALAKVPGLTVIGRTSAFQFKGQNKDMRAIGKALGVNNLIEGSVRKAGNQVRITAQLINVADGTHLWTESYDRELKDIFAVQEDIATAIAGAMRVPLGLAQGERLVPNRTDDLDAYQQYLHARALYRARKPDDVIAILTSVVTRDPKYAPPWALLAETYILPSQYKAFESAARAGSLEDARRLAQSSFDRAEKAAREAIRLDPLLAIGYSALSDIQLNLGNWAASEDFRRQAMMLDPNDPDILYGYSVLLASTGRLKDARRVQNQILAQEPFVPNYNRQAADVLWAMGDNDTAITMLEALAPSETRNNVLAKVYATAGRYAQAADTLLAIPQSINISHESVVDAARLLRSAPAKTSAPDALPELGQGLNWVYLFVGAEDRSLEVAEREMAAGYYAVLFRDPWGPPSASLRKTERFKMFVRQARLVEYWRARGWPDLCHPVGADDFACK